MVYICYSLIMITLNIKKFATLENIKNNVINCFLTFVGFMLSPLSWWNDALINLPLAYLFTIPFGSEYFLPALIGGYWITNVIGFLMMHHGVKGIALQDKKELKLNKKELINNLLMSVAYTVIVSALVIKGIIVFPEGFFN